MPTVRFQNFAFDAIERMSLSASRDELAATLSVPLGELGYSAIACGIFPSDADEWSAIRVLDQFPSGWRECYQREGFFACNHIRHHAGTTIEPFEISEAPYSPHEASNAKRLLQALSTYGMRKSVIIPTGRVAGRPSYAAIGGPDPTCSRPPGAPPK